MCKCIQILQTSVQTYPNRCSCTSVFHICPNIFNCTQPFQIYIQIFPNVLQSFIYISNIPQCPNTPKHIKRNPNTQKYIQTQMHPQNIRTLYLNTPRRQTNTPGEPETLIHLKEMQINVNTLYITTPNIT